VDEEMSEQIKPTEDQIKAARKAYDDAQYAAYTASPWTRSSLNAKFQAAKKELLRLDPNALGKVS
jgi:hypothetical protein